MFPSHYWRRKDQSSFPRWMKVAVLYVISISTGLNALLQIEYIVGGLPDNVYIRLILLIVAVTIVYHILYSMFMEESR